MTNSTFIEGYATDSSLVYAPYKNNARVSFAHGWATGPTNSLTTNGAGILLTSDAGKLWTMQSNTGGLSQVSAGFSASLGSFSASWQTSGGKIVGSFTTPSSSSGTLRLQASSAVTVTIVGPTTSSEKYTPLSGYIDIVGLAGGLYKVTVS